MNRQHSQSSQWWLYSGLLLLLFGIIPLCYLSISSLRSVNAQRTELTERYARALGLTNHLRFHQSHEYALALKYALTGDKNIIPQIEESRVQFIETVDKLKNIDPSRQTAGMLDSILSHKSNLAYATNPVWKKKHSVSQVHAFMEEHGKVFNEKITTLLDKYFEYELVRMTKMRAKVNLLSKRLDHAVVSTSIMTCVGFLGVVLLLFRLSKSARAYENAREELYNQIEKTAQVRKDVLESVSHDLKNPISTIKLGGQMLARILKDNPNEKVEMHLHRIENSTIMMQSLIEDLLDSVKVESGNLELDLHAENPLDLARDAIDGIATIAEEKNISLEFESSPLFHLVSCDKKRIQQVFSNLLGNSLKFTPVKGQIKVSVFEEDERTCFLIKDSGPGISQENIPHLFNRFWQADKKGKAGTGLGLAIVKGIVEKHGGSVAVKSQSGEGSSFIFSIPFAESETTFTPPSFAPQEAQSQSLS